MATLETINIGASANDGTGDSAREAFRISRDNDVALNADIATLDSEKADLAGDTFTGMVGFGGKTSPSKQIHVLGDADQFGIDVDLSGEFGDIQYLTNNVLRWILRKNNTVESGSNLGSDFELISRSDAGANLGTVLFVQRSNKLTKMQGIYDNITASAANVVVTSDGSTLRSTSSERFKEIIEEIKPEFSKNIYEIAEKCTVFYKSKSENDNSDWTWYGLSAEKLAEIEPRLVHWGFFDEDYEFIEKEVIRKVKVKDKKTGKISEKKIKEVELERVLKKDAKLSPVGVQYERFIPLMLVEMNRQKDELESLKKDVAELKELLKK